MFVSSGIISEWKNYPALTRVIPTPNPDLDTQRHAIFPIIEWDMNDQRTEGTSWELVGWTAG